ncbi:MAG TPA: hypothetical protein VFK09_08315 [Gemmatimonadales bacterium]|jgi:hypothetical protein|nr:hypothetical protein [Gemmatimonadales bacterium]
MSGTPLDPEEPTPAGDQPSPAALAATEQPVTLRVALLEDERVPEGMVCMGTYRNGRLVARCAMPPEAWDQLQEYKLFDDPVPVVLVAREAPPGLQCQLFAMVTLPPDFPLEDDEREPWADSVPSSSYEAAVAESEEDEDDDQDDARVAPIPLGNVVRFAKDRVHPDSLPLEAVDVLQRIIDGKTSEIVDKALEDLLGG